MSIFLREDGGSNNRRTAYVSTCPAYSFLPPWILKKRLLHEGDHEETRLCYQHMQRLLSYHRVQEAETISLSYAALPDTGCHSPAHRRVMHLKT
ncbi:hypothetical protein UA45_08490 [Morganella morganii]|uniref:Uncharacterized protein n=1 Tax=Morganella morganii TaxID=582 RepID=A0A0D8L8I5_MORMO|nr:hypothetical protein UA45_08490 [Morganella morganii]